MSTLNEAQDFAASLRYAQTDPGTVVVDPDFTEDPEASRVVEYAIRSRRNLLIVGQTGCGKSSLAINVAARLKERMEIFSCSGETSTDELMAKPWRKSDGQMVTIHGAGVRAYRDGKVLLLEEVDHAQPDILACTHRLLEVGQNFITLNAGEEETVPRNPRFACIATANTIGTGEDSFMYAGTKPLNLAFMNRFSLTIQMGFLDPDKEIEVLIRKTKVPMTMATTMVAVATEARKALEQKTISTVLSTRDLIEWGKAVMGMKIVPKTAAPYVFLNRTNEADREVLSRLVENRF